MIGEAMEGDDEEVFIIRIPDDLSTKDDENMKNILLDAEGEWVEALTNLQEYTDSLERAEEEEDVYDMNGLSSYKSSCKTCGKELYGFATKDECYACKYSSTHPEKEEEELGAGEEPILFEGKLKVCALCKRPQTKSREVGYYAQQYECVQLNQCRKFRGLPEYSTTGGTTTANYKCRHFATPAFKIGDVVFYGGSESKVKEQASKLNRDEWLIVSLLGSSKVPVHSLFGWEESLLPYTISPQVTVDWTDYGAPPLLPGFWAKLVSNALEKGFKHVLLYCMGGHGRTGTGLAGILVECSNVTPSDAVKWVRDKYCKEAVESEAQINYLVNSYKTLQGIEDEEEVESEVGAKESKKSKKAKKKLLGGDKADGK